MIYDVSEVWTKDIPNTSPLFSRISYLPTLQDRALSKTLATYMLMLADVKDTSALWQ